eukprot:11679299-Alexandrium_andersonii.AAC.1
MLAGRAASRALIRRLRSALPELESLVGISCLGAGSQRKMTSWCARLADPRPVASAPICQLSREELRSAVLSWACSW